MVEVWIALTARFVEAEATLVVLDPGSQFDLTMARVGSYLTTVDTPRAVAGRDRWPDLHRQLTSDIQALRRRRQLAS